MKIVRKLAILAALGFALVLVIELVMRFAFPVTMEPTTRLVMKSDSPYFSDTEIVYEITPDGLRGYQWSKEKKPEALRILVVGANSTGHMLQNVESTWWGQLASMLEKKTGRRVEAAAVVGVPDGRILSGYRWAAKVLEKTPVDLLLVCYGYGDVMEPPFDFAYDPERINTIAVEKPRGFKYKLAEVSQICRRVRRGRVAEARRAQLAPWRQENQYLAMLQASMARYQQLPPVAAVLRKDDPMREYLQGVEAFIALAKAKNVKLLVLGEPTIHHEFLGRDSLAPLGKEQDGRLRLTTPVLVGPGPNDAAAPTPEWVQGELDRYYGYAALACKEAGVPFLSLNGATPRNTDYFLTDVLVTDKGAAKMAELVLPAAEPLIP